MKNNNERREVKFVSGTVSLNRMHLTSAGIVTAVLVLGDVAATAEIM